MTSDYISRHWSDGHDLRMGVFLHGSPCKVVWGLGLNHLVWLSTSPTKSWTVGGRIMYCLVVSPYQSSMLSYHLVETIADELYLKMITFYWRSFFHTTKSGPFDFCFFYSCPLAIISLYWLNDLLHSPWKIIQTLVHSFCEWILILLLKSLWEHQHHYKIHIA